MTLENLLCGEYCQAKQDGELTSIERLRRAPPDCQRHHKGSESVITHAKHFVNHDQWCIFASENGPDDTTTDSH